jgi:hypothetical protein
MSFRLEISRAFGLTNHEIKGIEMIVSKEGFYGEKLKELEQYLFTKMSIKFKKLLESGMCFEKEMILNYFRNLPIYQFEIDQAKLEKLANQIIEYYKSVLFQVVSRVEKTDYGKEILERRAEFITTNL